MAAIPFVVTAKNVNAKSAFDAIVGQHRREFGRGRSGTIADKDAYIEAASCILTVSEAREFIKDFHASHNRSQRIADCSRVDGPACCLQIGRLEWAFFGWAQT
jgi:hypothetical protein